ncbi:DUF7662 domain-containing protein [Bradyrhizobium manausense]|uniref:DUF7662 domain-containing protein n=1 Tax=Bradyrhizobium manausense TaxID=989370 RepID=UPI001BAD972C|nr:hypothetical protein [Bradyrhizobium manausense]MBR0724136.1 hypothetical protein [Bradyrhizobium manausense]
MAIHLIVAKVLREELSAIGIRSLTAEESETIASRIFERITELELELTARDFHSTSLQKSQRDGPRVMSVYDPLQRKLKSVREPAVRLTFSEIEEILGRPLPASAYKYSAWWDNEKSRPGHAHSFAWLDAGFKARVSMKKRTVEFNRT